MAERAVGDIENKFSKMNPQIKTSFLGNLLAQFAGQALAGAVEGVKELANRFTDLQKTAEYAGVSLQWVYGLQEVGQKAGASIEQINASVKSLAFQLDEMKRGGENPLQQLLKAPGNQQFLKGFNKDAATAEETLTRVLTIIGKMPNMIQAVDVGQKLGISADIAAEAWRKGGDAMAEAIAKAAAKAPDLQQLAEKSAALARIWNALRASRACRACRVSARPKTPSSPFRR